MIRSIIIGLGISVIGLGIQFFCLQELTIKTDTVKEVRVEDFMPYSLICVGLMIYFYGYQLRKTS